jgi:hypothetical protein
MSDIQVGIKITADGTIVGLQGTTVKLGEAARDMASLSAGWAAFSAQGAAKLAAIDNARRLTDGLTAASAQAERLRRNIALFDPRPLKELDATVKASQSRSPRSWG